MTDAMTVAGARVEAASDRELVLASYERAEAFEALFDRHATAIYRYLRLRVGSGLAEDLAAETFTRAFQGRRRFDRRAESALPWLFGIAANLIRMHRRTEERRLRAYARSPVGSHPAPAEDSHNRVDAAAVRLALAAALASLPATQREVLLLHAWADLSHDEISAALGISNGTVRSRLHRARTHVAERLARFGNETSGNAIHRIQ
jgi:RNA polymerase sigma-70 factor (ECF subfamily)